MIIYDLQMHMVSSTITLNQANIKLEFCRHIYIMLYNQQI